MHIAYLRDRRRGEYQAQPEVLGESLVDIPPPYIADPAVDRHRQEERPERRVSMQWGLGIVRGECAIGYLEELELRGGCTMELRGEVEGY